MKTIPGFTSEATKRDGRVDLGLLEEVLDGPGVFQTSPFSSPRASQL
jgi:hypothetical protein